MCIMQVIEIFFRDCLRVGFKNLFWCRQQISKCRDTSQVSQAGVIYCAIQTVTWQYRLAKCLFPDRFAQLQYFTMHIVQHISVHCLSVHQKGKACLRLTMTTETVMFAGGAGHQDGTSIPCQVLDNHHGQLPYKRTSEPQQCQKQL